MPTIADQARAACCNPAHLMRKDSEQPVHGQIDLFKTVLAKDEKACPCNVTRAW